ncbi:FkbM family methyltransferase [Paenibacillus puldeungensis]|uniref:FkbM family methyltransferase n=1 Tax=Paenibacillus puldeungensis TaxID=696536 RepID=A0ABW3RTK5_9BACL
MSSIQKIILLESNTILYVDEHDNRGKWLIKQNGITQPHVTGIWRKIVNKWQPTIAIDVGVNYGEIMFSTAYDHNIQIVGIEANKLLDSCISKSIAEHPNASQIKMIYALASDKDTDENTFFVDKEWSGTSAVVPNNEHKFRTLKVNSTRIDSLFADQSLVKERLLFKIDVEGYEQFVLHGMNRLIKECSNCIGIIEFNSEFLERAGTDVDDFLRFLNENFKVYLLYSSFKVYHFERMNLESLKKHYRNEHFQKDLLLLSDNETIQQLDLKVKEIGQSLKE